MRLGHYIPGLIKTEPLSNFLVHDAIFLSDMELTKLGVPAWSERQSHEVFSALLAAS